MQTLVQVAELIGVPSILSAVMILWLSRRMNRLDSRGETRRQENVLILKGLLKIGGLASATARALKEGMANGNVADALDDYVEYKEQLSAYLVDQASRKMD